MIRHTRRIYDTRWTFSRWTVARLLHGVHGGGLGRRIRTCISSHRSFHNIRDVSSNVPKNENVENPIPMSGNRIVVRSCNVLFWSLWTWSSTRPMFVDARILTGRDYRWYRPCRRRINAVWRDRIDWHGKSQWPKASKVNARVGQHST